MMDLTDNKNLFQAIFDSAPNGIAVMEPIYNEQGRIEDFTMLLFNAYTLQWIGNIDYKGKRYGDIFPTVKSTGILEKFIEVAETGITTKLERWYEGEGMKHWFQFTAVKQADLLVVTTDDITEAKRAEKQERLYDSITNNTPDLVYVFDLNYKFTYANKALLTMWGKSAKDAIGKGLRENGYEEWHAQMHEREIDEVAATGKQVRGTVSFPHAELGSRVYDYILIPIFNEQGIVEAVGGTTRDVTEQILTQKKLEESEGRFRALVNTSSDVIYSLNADWTVMNPLDGRGFLLSTQEPLKNWMEQNVHSADLQTVKKTIANVIRTKSVFEMEHRVNTIDGGTGWTFSRAIPILDEQNNIIEWFGAASDITERKKAEAALKRSEADLRNLVLQSPTGICLIDAKTLVNEIVNDKFVEISGKPYDAVFGQKHWDTFAEAAPYYSDALQEVIDKGEAFYANEVELMLIRHGKEEMVFVSFVYEPMKDPNGTVKKVVVWVMENTVQVQARQKVEESESRYKELSESLEHQVNERTKELKRSNADLQQFAHVASHDLKEPVRKIKTFTSRLEEKLEGTLDEVSAQYIERIHAATDRMFMMIDGVLSYSKINAGLQTPVLIDLNEIIGSIESDLEVPLQNVEGKIHFDGLPTLSGAEVLIYQLFYNLINNAIKFARKDVPLSITVSSKIAAHPKGDSAVITLEDNGIGFDPQYAEKIFETFTRLNSKDFYEGTGLGLSLCKKIVERHGGTISAVGAPEQGATFTIILPLQQRETSI